MAWEEIAGAGVEANREIMRAIFHKEQAMREPSEEDKKAWAALVDEAQALGRELAEPGQENFEAGRRWREGFGDGYSSRARCFSTICSQAGVEKVCELLGAAHLSGEPEGPMAVDPALMGALDRSFNFANGMEQARWLARERKLLNEKYPQLGSQRVCVGLGSLLAHTGQFRGMTRHLIKRVLFGQDDRAPLMDDAAALTGSPRDLSALTREALQTATQRVVAEDPSSAHARFLAVTSVFCASESLFAQAFGACGDFGFDGMTLMLRSEAVLGAMGRPGSVERTMELLKKAVGAAMSAPRSEEGLDRCAKIFPGLKEDPWRERMASLPGTVAMMDLARRGGLEAWGLGGFSSARQAEPLEAWAQDGLRLAAWKGDQALARQCEEAGARPDAASGAGVSAAMCAGAKNRVDWLERWEGRFDPNAVDVEGRSAAHHAGWGGALDSCRWLDGRVDWDQKDGAGQTPLHWAAKSGHVECAQWLATKSDVEALDAQGITASQAASIARHGDLSDWLLAFERARRDELHIRQASAAAASQPQTSL